MSARFLLRDTPIAGVRVVERMARADDRGFLERLFCAEELAAAGFDAPPAQINRTLTRRKGALRGLHFQNPPHAEIKLVSCLHGEVFDVAVDLRCGSPTFLRWHAETLSGDNRRALLIPRGCAHGFQTRTSDCELLYIHSAAYAPQAEGGARHDDPRIGVRWPEAPAEISARDSGFALLDDAFEGIAP